MPLFSRSVETRGYEPDRFATVPVQRFLNYLEWLRWEFIQDPDTGLVEGLREGHFPVVRSQRFELIQRIGMGRKLRLWARVTKVGRSTVTLEHHVVSEDDNTLVAHAVIEGLWLGPSRRLARIPDVFRSVAAHHTEQANPSFIVPEPKQVGHDGPLIHTAPPPCIFERKGVDILLEPSTDSAFRCERRVRPSDIDIFSHVNAATYVDMFEDALYEAFKSSHAMFDDCSRPGPINRLAIHYDRESVLDEQLSIYAWRTNDKGFGLELRRTKDEAVLCRAVLIPQESS